MLCLLYLFLIVLCGLLQKTVEQQYLLSLYDILVVYRKQDRPILVADRYAQFIEVRINQFFDYLGVNNLHLGYHKQQIPDFLLDIIRQGLEKLIEGFGSVNLSHEGNKFITFCKIKSMAGVRIKSLQAATPLLDEQFDRMLFVVGLAEPDTTLCLSGAELKAAVGLKEHTNPLEDVDGLGGGSVGGAIPMVREHTLLGGNMDRFLVDCQPAKDRGLALRIAVGSLNEERCIECRTHDDRKGI